MAWIAITESDVEETLLGPELERVRQAAGAEDGSDDDKLPGIIAKVTNELRGHIESCPQNRVGAAGTLPERCHRHALAIIRHSLLTRLKMAVGDDRAREYKSAEAFFIRVSECKVKMEQPDDGDVVSEANTPTVDVVQQTTQEMGKTSLKGLF